MYTIVNDMFIPMGVVIARGNLFLPTPTYPKFDLDILNILINNHHDF